MSVSQLLKTHVNGYDVIRVGGGPWKVCTGTDRLGSFQTREEAMAYVVSLPMHRVRQPANQ
ncbi:DUF2188 domain-containing protein [Pseudomonas asplenii]|uniref:DUF2188 domain-containing protein n=1 Tax=Pseudomonas asplenii TaxID=53407 RepID=UPI0023611662|nr:DUF2188 domain-containing protein [Pseudomonas asplenii]